MAVAGKAGGRLLAAYLVVGADELKREVVVRRLKGRLDEGLAAFNLDERAASPDLEPQELVASLNTLPVGAAFRLVIVHGADKLAKPVSEAIVSYLANPNPACVLCLVAESLSKGTRLYKAVAAVGKGAILDCAPPKRWELPNYVIKHAASPSIGISVDRDAAEELVSRVGESTTMIDRQLRSLAELCRASGRVTLGDVEDNVARTAEVKPWDFLDAVSARRADRALELYRLMASPSHIALLALLVSRLRELVCAASLDRRGRAGAVASELGKRDWQVKNHVRWARAFAPGELEGCLVACAACERVLKGTGDDETAFVSLVLRICGRA